MNYQLVKNDYEYDVYDTCLGKVVDKCGTGIYIELDGGYQAFAYDYTSLAANSIVLCSIKCKATDSKRILVTIDSVIEYATMVA